MANPDNVNVKPEDQKGKTKDFGAFLRAVDPDRLSPPANNPEKPLLLKRQVRDAREKMLNTRLLQATGILVSAMWLAGASVYVQRTVGWSNVSSLMPHEMGGFLAGILTPIALFWMIAAFILRSNDVKMYAEALREEIQSMIFPSEEADRRVNNDIERLMRQTAEMSKATRTVLVAIEAAREAVRTQVSALNGSSEQAVDRLAMLGQTLETRMRDAAHMGQALEEAVQSIETRAEKGNEVWQNLIANLNTQTTEAEEKINAGRERLESSVNRVQQTTQKLADKIDTTASSSEMTIARLANMLQERLESIGTLHQETEAALKNATEEMATQRRDLRLEADAIEEKTYSLSDALSKGVQKLYDFSDDALDKAKLIETRLQGQSVSLESVLNQAVDHAAHIEDRTTAAVEKLENVAQNTLGGLQSVTDQAVDKLESVTQSTLDSFQNVTDKAVGKLETATGNTLNTLQNVTDNAVNALQATAQNTVGNLQDVTNEAVGKLEATTRHTLDSLKSTTDEAVSTFTNVTQSTLGNLKIVTDESVAKLQDISTNAVDQLQTTTDNAVTKLHSLTDRSIAETQKIESVLQGAIARLEDRAVVAVQTAQDNLANSSNRLVTDIDEVSTRAKNIATDMLGEINRKVVDTTSAFVYIQKQIQSLVGLFDQRKMHLDEAGEGARKTAETLQRTLQNALDKVHDTTIALQNGIAAIHQSVQEPILLVENTAQNVYQKATDIGNLLENRAGSLTSITGKLGNDLIAMEEQFNAKGQDVAILAGKVAGHLQTVSQQLENQNNVLETRIAKSADSLDDLARTQERITQGLIAMQEQAGLTQNQTTQSTAEIQKRVDLLQQLQRSLAAESKASQDQLDRVSDRLISISTSTVDKIKNTIENMTLLEADYHRLSDAGIDDIRRLETGYRETLSNVQLDADNLIAKMTGLHDGLQENLRQAKHELSQHLGAIENTAVQIRETSANVLADVSTIQDEAARVQDLGSASQNTLEQIITISRSLDDRIAESQNHVSIQIESLREVMNDMQEQSLQAVDAFIQQETQLEQQMQAQAAKITETGQRFVEQGDQIQSHLAQTVNTADQYTLRIKEHADELRQQSENLEGNLANTIGKLLAQGDQIDLSATRLIDKVNQANMDLIQHGKTLQNSGDDIMARIRSVTTDMNDRANALEQAAQLAQKQAEALRQQEAKLQRDAFFNSTKFVVESLHSLALDFTRLLEGELPEKTWRAYQKGDTGSFTRRLLSARDEETRDKVKNKHKNDVEFRTYVARYLRQFEEIYDNASENDHADLLATIFMTSDVGKLYTFLCSVLDREPRSPQKQAA